MATVSVAGSSEPTGVLDASAVRRWVERTCAAQSLPVHITDPTVIARLVTLLGSPASASTAVAA